MREICAFGLGSVALLASFIVNAAPQDGMPWSQINEIYRACLIDGKNCEQAKSFLQATLTPGETLESATKLQKDFLNKCSAARISLGSIKTDDALIAHNYKLLECFLGDAPDNSWQQDEHLRATYEANTWMTIAYMYYGTEYQLGKLTKDEFTKQYQIQGQANSMLMNDAKIVSEEAAEIEQLKAQLSSLQSADHLRCRQIQALAASNGATPQVCP